MQHLKKMMMIMTLCGFVMVSVAGAQITKKIVMFEDGISQADKTDFVAGWEAYGVTLLMDLPFINAVALGVPETITAEDLAADYRVADVDGGTIGELPALEDLTADYHVADVDGGTMGELQALNAIADVAAADGGAADGGAADGGAADGGAADGGAVSAPVSFITPADALPNGHRPHGVLATYDMPYDQNQISSFFHERDLAASITQALNKRKIKRVNVAIFDTGVDGTHPVLFSGNKSELKGGVDLVNMVDDIPMDDNGHGTHVAGTLVGSDLGIARGVNLYVVKMLDAYAMGDVTTLIMGLQWAIDNNIDIVNLSIAFRDDIPAVHAAVKSAHEAGIIMVAAVGNHSNWDDEGTSADGGAADGGAADGGAADGGAADGGAADGGAADGGAADGGAADGGAADGGAADGGAAGDGSVDNPYPVMYPAAYPEVIAVGAHDAYGQIAAFSNSGPELDITAPGKDILSANTATMFGICSGTSMATPHVTGAVALMLSLAKEQGATLAPHTVKNILNQTAWNGQLDLIAALAEVDYLVQNEQ